MRATSLVLVSVLALALGACGHKKPKEAKTTSAPPAAAENKCEVKGFTYSMPAPGPIKDVAAVTDGGAQ